MLAGVERLADAVTVTLGPKGRCAIIEQSFGAPKVTKDGVTVAKAIDFEDKFENLGASLVKQVASKTNDIAGDGTTTSTVLARAIFKEGVQAVAAGANPMDLMRGCKKGSDAIVKEIEKNSREIASEEEIRQVATISANSDTEVGELISRAMKEVGRDGVITIQDGKTLFDELEVVEGMTTGRGYISPYFVNDKKGQNCEFENPYILLVEKKVSSVHSLIPILDQVNSSGKPLLIIAEDVESEALAALILNKLRSGLKVCAIKAPGFGDNRKANLQDIAGLTGGQVVSEDLGMKLETVELKDLGMAKTVKVSKDDTIILDGAGDKTALGERIETIGQQVEATKSEYEKEKLQERLAKLSGGVAVLKVGGGSDAEVSEKKDRVTDALNATRAAVEEGVVAGGGSALLHASKTLDALINDETNRDIREGIQIIQRATRVPARAISDNAAYDGIVIASKVLEYDDVNMGYNAQTGEYVNMLEAGILDPSKVVKTALIDANSISSLMVTTESAICDLPEKEGAGGGMGGMPGGMGGMGGMPGMM